MSERRMLIPVLVERTTKADVPVEVQNDFGDKVLFTVFPLHEAFKDIVVMRYNDRAGALERFSERARDVLRSNPTIRSMPEFSLEMVECGL